MARKSTKTKRINVRKYVLNCVPSTGTEEDWTFEDAIDSEVVSMSPQIPSSKDLQ